MEVSFENVSLHKDTREEPILNNVSFKIEPGEFVTLVGHSGAGKSTIFKVILAEEEIDEGRVCVDGGDIDTFSHAELLQYRRDVGSIFQEYRLLKHKTVYENIAFAMEALEASPERIASDVPYVLDLVDLGNKAGCFPPELSGGELHRVSIARAIVNKQDLLLADEPTGNLDPINTHEIINILKQINSLGTTIILATHEKDVVEKIGGRVITVSGGKIKGDDPKGRYTL